MVYFKLNIRYLIYYTIFAIYNIINVYQGNHRKGSQLVYFFSSRQFFEIFPLRFVLLALAKAKSLASSTYTYDPRTPNRHDGFVLKR